MEEVIRRSLEITYCIVRYSESLYSKQNSSDLIIYGNMLDMIESTYGS